MTNMAESASVPAVHADTRSMLWKASDAWATKRALPVVGVDPGGVEGVGAEVEPLEVEGELGVAAVDLLRQHAVRVDGARHDVVPDVLARLLREHLRGRADLLTTHAGCAGRPHAPATPAAESRRASLARTANGH